MALLLALSVLHVVVLLSEYAATALTAVLAFEGPSADGPFQLYNALRRIEDGQRPGVDFVFFHGVGVPYLHYPVYAALGSTVFASEVARVLVSPVVAVVVTAAFFAALTRSLRRTVVLSGVGVALVYLMDLGSLLGPANSLLGVRTAVPVLFAALLLWQHARGAAGWRADVAAGLVLALALVMGTEQGIALVAAHALVVLVGGAGRATDRLIALGQRTAVAVAGTVVLTLLATRSPSGAVASLRFALSEVPHDQFWYFGAPPNAFVSQLHQPLSDWRFLVPVVAAVAVLVLLVLLGRRALVARPVLVALAVLLVYGLISAAAYLGIAIFTTAEPCARAVVLALLALAHVATSDRDGPLAAPPDVRAVLTGSAVGVLGLALLIGQPGRLPVALDAAGTYARQGGALGPGLTELTRQTDALIGTRPCRDGEPSYVWSTYVGIVEAQRGCFHPDTDYAIHALGPERRERYVDSFRQDRPEFVQTLRRDGFRYEDWLRHTTWPLYEALLQDYRPAGLTRGTVVWERAPGEGMSLGPWADLDVDDTAQEVVLDVAPGTDLVVVELGYRTRNLLGPLPVLGQLARHLVDAEPQLLDTAVPLDPTRDTVRFPVVVPEGARTVTVRTTTASLLPGAGLELTSVRHRPGRLPDEPLWREALLS